MESCSEEILRQSLARNYDYFYYSIKITRIKRRRRKRNGLIPLFNLFVGENEARAGENLLPMCDKNIRFKACVSAYPKNKEACEKLSEDLALCKARLVDKCTAKAEKFEEMCVKLMVVREQSNEEKRKCAKAAKNMQKCVKRF